MTTDDRCGYTVTDEDGIEQPCDLPATGWRWYQDVEHEDLLEVACIYHENEGGRRMYAAEAKNEEQFLNLVTVTNNYIELARERDALAAKIERVEALATECEGQHGQCWNSILGQRIRAALADPAD